MRIFVAVQGIRSGRDPDRTVRSGEHFEVRSSTNRTVPAHRPGVSGAADALREHCGRASGVPANRRGRLRGTRQSRDGLPTLHHGSTSPAAATSERLIFPARLGRSCAVTRSRTVMPSGSMNRPQGTASLLGVLSTIFLARSPTTLPTWISGDHHDIADPSGAPPVGNRLLREHSGIFGNRRSSGIDTVRLRRNSLGVKRDSAMCVVHTEFRNIRATGPSLQHAPPAATSFPEHRRPVRCGGCAVRFWEFPPFPSGGRPLSPSAR